MAIISTILVYFHDYYKQLANKHQQASSSQIVGLPSKWVGSIFELKDSEPSGITYHPIRKTLLSLVMKEICMRFELTDHLFEPSL